MGDLNPYNKYRLLSFYREIMELRDGHIPPPRMAIVYPSYNCNQNCDYCFYAEERNEYRDVMFDHEQFIHVIDKLTELGVCGVEYCGGGEPFTNPHILKATRHGLARGLKFGALTNGTLLMPDLLELVQNDFSYIRFSVDSFDRERYIAKRRPASDLQFGRMVSNLIHLGTKRSPINGGLKVGVKMLLTPDSMPNMVYDIDEALKKCAAWQVDSLQVKVGQQQGEPFNEVFTLSDQLSAYIDGERPKYKFPILAGFERTKIREKCWLCPLQLTVDPFGDVYLCCYYQHRKDSHLLCNIFDDDLLKIWGSPFHRRKVVEIKIDECNTFNCRFHGYHQTANAVVDDLLQLQFC